MKIQFSVIGILVIISLFFAFFFLGRVSTKRERDRLNLAVIEGKKHIKNDSIIIAGLKYKTFTQETYIVNSERSLKELTNENEKLKALKIKNVQLIALLNAKVSALEMQGEYVTIVRDTVELWDENEIILPDYVTYKDEWVDVSVALKTKPIFNVRMDSIPLQLTIADKKTGLFKKNPTVSIIDTPNPYVSIDKNDVVIVKKPKKWYQTKLFAILASVGITYAIVK